MLYLELFISFLKVGFTSFGGMSMVPVINEEMTSHGWMTLEEVSDIVAIAEMTPGPFGMNCATFAGIRAGGVLGAVMANLGVLAPTLTLCLLVGLFFARFKKSRLMQEALYGIRPACIGMIGAAVWSMSVTNYAPGGIVSPMSIVLGVLLLGLMLWKNPPIPLVVILSAGLGLVLL